MNFKSNSITTLNLDSKYFKYTVREEGFKRPVQDNGVNDTIKVKTKNRDRLKLERPLSDRNLSADVKKRRLDKNI